MISQYDLPEKKYFKSIYDIESIRRNNHIDLYGLRFEGTWMNSFYVLD